MRLIDADAFRRKLDEHYPFTKDEQSKHGIADIAKSAVLFVLNTMPTVEERKTGTWIVSENPDGRWINLKCPFCGGTISYYIHTEARPNFCINCGAKMET